MILYAAIDLRGGQAVQLVGGRTDAQRIALPDPVAVALRWMDAGFPALHVVDLDAALGTGDNRAVIGEILTIATIPVQVGGGLRDGAAIGEMLDAGAERVMVGTRAIEDASWRRQMADAFPRRLMVAADVRDAYIVTHGWTRETGLAAQSFLAQVADEPLAAVLVTDVAREGQMIGIDQERFRVLVESSAHDLIAAGGIRDLDDLRALEGAGAAGAVLGMSLYTGAIDPVAAVAEFL